MQLLLGLGAFVLLPAVLLHVNAQEPSCENARAALGASSYQIFSSLRLQGGSVCQLTSTCCSLVAETAFKSMRTQGHEAKVSTHMTQGLRTCRNHAIFRFTSTYIAETKVQLVGDITRIYRLYFRRFVSLFDRFFGYLAESVQTGNLTELPVEFNQVFFEVYFATFISNPNAPRNLPSTPEFRECFYNIFLETEASQIQGWLRGFERSWNITMRYFRALKAMERVVEGILSQQNLTEQCQVSLMKMTDCARCAGFPDSTQSCNGLCLNTMRGCLLDLSDLVVPIQEFSQALIGMKERVQTFNPFNQITLLQSNIFNFISSSSGSFFATFSQINTRCLSSGRGRRETDQSMSDGVSHRSARATITVPLDALNDSAYSLLNNLDLFSHLPDVLCGGEGVSGGNEHCWSGRQLGSYSRSVVEYSRRLQGNNPEVLICPQQRSRFAAEIRLLRYITRELNALTGACSDDDEDCLVVPPTTLYYDLDAIDLSDPSNEEGSEDSGSGDGDSCQPPTIAATTATPTTSAATTIASTTSAATTATPTTSAATTIASTTLR